MPTLPTAPRRSYLPAPVKRPYQPHQERSKEYDSPLWRRLRADHLRRHPLCVACTAKGDVSPATLLDHIVAVRDGGEFFESTNHQGLCKTCHFSKSAKEHQARRKAAASSR